MKIAISILGLIAAVALFAFWMKQQQSKARISDVRFCAFQRQILDEAKYWYALDNGLTSGASLVVSALMSYLPEGYHAECPAGGRYAVEPIGSHIRCSIAQHMEDSFTQDYSVQYPMDPESTDHWLYTASDTPRGLLIKMTGIQLLIENLHTFDGSSGAITMGGSGSSSGISTHQDGNSIRTSYGGGIGRMDFLGHRIEIRDQGRQVEVDGTTITLAGNRQSLILHTNGTLESVSKFHFATRSEGQQVGGILNSPNNAMEPTMVRGMANAGDDSGTQPEQQN